MRVAHSISLALGVCLLGLSAAYPLPSKARQLDPQTPEVPEIPEVPALAELNWLAGHWRERTERGWTEELWTPASGELMVGLNRSLKKGSKQAAFEFLRIARTPAGIVLYASPGGQAPTPFMLIRHAERRAVFANPKNAFPTHIEYQLTEDGKLSAKIWAATPGPAWSFDRVGTIE